MVRSLKKSPVAWLALGCLIGFVIGGMWPSSQAHATATDRFENFAICTGGVDDGLEALYVLDSLTGELKAAVISQQLAKFTFFFSRNIVADLGLVGQESPRFLMVSGSARLAGRAGALNRATQGLLYVAEVNSGRIAVYALPWAGQRGVGGAAATQQEMLLLEIIPFRRQDLIRPGVGGGAVGGGAAGGAGEAEKKP